MSWTGIEPCNTDLDARMITISLPRLPLRLVNLYRYLESIVFLPLRSNVEKSTAELQILVRPG